MITPVNLKVRMSWDKNIDTRKFFELMPYMLNHFDFNDSGSQPFIMYNLSCRPGNYKRIYYTAERGRPNMKSCDWALTFTYDEDLKNPRHFRFPNYVRVGAGIDLIKTKINVQKELQKRTKFCAFIYSNRTATVRNKFFDKLSKYKRIDAPGKAKNNIRRLDGHKRVKKLTKYGDKINFLKQYKFCIAFENYAERGYTTEKLYHAMKAGCIPIYWGNPLVKRDFNQNSFLYNQNKHKNLNAMLDDLVERVIQVDKDPDLYANLIQKPWYPNNKLTKYTNPDNVIRNFKKIFGST